MPRCSNEYAEKTAVKRHAAFPYGKNLEGVFYPRTGLIKKSVAQPPPYHNTNHGAGEKSVDMFFFEKWRKRRGVDDAAHPMPAKEDASNISKAVPTNGERPKTQKDGINAGEGECEHNKTICANWRILKCVAI